MKCSIPESLPARGVFVRKMLEAVFPTLAQDSAAYSYAKACSEVLEELNLPYPVDKQDKYARSSSFADIEIQEDSDLFHLMYELDLNRKRIFGKTWDILKNKAYQKNFSSSVSLNSFCDKDGCLKTWLKKDGQSGAIKLTYETSLLFSYLLTKREACKEKVLPFTLACLEMLGVTELEDTILWRLSSVSWSTSHEKSNHGGKTFYRLSDKTVITLSVSMVTILELLGKDGGQCQNNLQEYYGFLKELFADEIRAEEAMEAAEEQLFRCIRFFEPRSINLTRECSPQEFFVMPCFEQNHEKKAPPSSRIAGAGKSCRQMIMAKTGMGKSAFLQILTLCILQKKRGFKVSYEEELETVAEKMGAPEDIYVLNIPARMFSYCYSHSGGRYRDWTEDLVTLYFNAVWNLSYGENFFESQALIRGLGDDDPDVGNQHEVSDVLREYLQYLEKEGRLLLILDSYDEIPSGNMRRAYNRALADFYDRHCDFKEKSEVGAHVLISSREMSPETMNKLKEALHLRDQDIFGIQELTIEQSRELVAKWKRYMGWDPSEAEEILEEIESNHYYMDYAVNPYMLSVVCFYIGYGLNGITDKFVTDLLVRLRKNNRNLDDVSMNVLSQIEKILQNIATDTVISGNPHFSRIKLKEAFSKYIDGKELTEEEINVCIEKLNEIFAMEVGLIVPADGDDSDYQFINNQIRYELAAKGIQNSLDSREIKKYSGERMLSAQNAEEYVGMLIPLICLNLKNYPLSEALVAELVMYDFKDQDEEKILIRAMMDLLLKRYGLNIVSIGDPGADVRSYVRRAQRMLLIRLFTSPSFHPTEKEKEDIAELRVYRDNANWLSDDIKKKLT